MKNILLKSALTFLVLLALNGISFAQSTKFKVLALYSTTVESDHVDFANDAITFYTKMAAEKDFVFDVTTDWARITKLKEELSKNLWRTVVPGLVSTCLAIMINIPNGPGLLILWVVQFFTTTIGRHYLQN
jgi:hypothetical protein